MTFEVKRGTNISHWLSQSDRRGEERRAWFTEADVARIKAFGLDHIRLPVDEEQLWDEAGKQEPEAWTLLDQALDWCQKAQLRVIVDLHILRSHYFNVKHPRQLFTEQPEADKFVDLWRRLQAHLQGRDTDAVAYELLNEAVADNDDDWNRVVMPVHQALRENEPERVIVLGSNRWNSVDTFDRLEVPQDEHLILTFHFYQPMLITHYQASWWQGGGYAGPVTYPGVPVAENDLSGLDPELRKIVEQSNRAFGPGEMEQALTKPLAVKAATGRSLYCGEFGCYQKCPQQFRLAWYRDLMSVFNRHEIAWANWDYKGGFGLVTADGSDTGIVAAMLGT